MDIDELVVLQTEVNELKQRREQFIADCNSKFDEKIAIINEIGKYKKILKETQESVRGLEKQEEELKSTIKSQLAMIEQENTKLSADKQKLAKDQESLDVMAYSIAGKELEAIRQRENNRRESTAISQREKDIERSKEELIRQGHILKSGASELAAEQKALAEKQVYLLRQMEALRAKQAEVDMHQKQVQQLKEESTQLMDVLEKKNNILADEIANIEKLKQELRIKIKDLEDAKALAKTEKQFYANRLADLDAKESQIKVLDLRVQKLIKDKDLKDEIDALEKSIRTK